jgi:hypothetical protein
MIKPQDLGESWLVDQCQRISIDLIIQKANREKRSTFISQEIGLLGIELNLTHTPTRFNGKRLWLVCPLCNSRRRDLYKHPMNNAVGCRECLNLKYRNQRYKGMIENSIAKY